ncbi:MAG: DUF1232 domain-containing protein [Myxococcota bacterium]|nr:DUF1232 domain-containing protein [Myxococcota bacterium]
MSDKGHEDGMNAEQEAKLQRDAEAHFERAVDEVDRDDVAYVLTKLDNKVEGVGNKALVHVQQLLRQVGVLGRLLKDWWQDDYQVPWRVIAAATASLLYFINPFDLMPDYLPFVGFLDDIVVVKACIRLIQSEIKDYAISRDIDLEELGMEPDPEPDFIDV